MAVVDGVDPGVVSSSRVDGKTTIVTHGRFHAFDLARELHRMGLLHRIVSAYPKYTTREFGIPDACSVSVPLIAVQRALERMFPRFAPRTYAWINVAFASGAAHCLEGTQVVHGWSGYSLPSLRWAKRNGAACVVERGSSHILTQVETLEEEYARLGLHWDRGSSRWIDRDLEEYEYADLIVVPSLYAKRSFLARGFGEERLLHAPFGASLDMFSPGPKSDRTFRVLYSGQLAVRKGIHYLVDAFEAANIDGSELCLIGSHTPETPLLLRHAGERVRCVPHVPQAELVHLYRSASVFAMASVEEGLALVQAQAMACGLPLVCSTNTGGEDLLRASGDRIAQHEGDIDEYPAGYVVPVRAPDAMARCLRWLAEQPELLESKRAAAAAIRDRSLSWSGYAQKVVAGYARLRPAHPA